MAVLAKIDALHRKARNFPFFQRFAVFTRFLLAIGFIAPGLTKLLGNRFTVLGIDNPVGFFFEALYQTGFYWRFLGFAQIGAAILTAIPRTATLGAVCFFPIILNIFIITVSIDFRGTPVITGLMLLANIFLLCMDYHKLKPLLFGYREPISVFEEVAPHWIERVGYVLMILTGILFTLMTRGLFPQTPRHMIWSLLALGILGGMLIFCGWIFVWRTHWSERSLTNSRRNCA